MIQNGNRSDSRSENGTALVIALFFTIIVSAVVATGTLTMHTHRAVNRTAFLVDSQALYTARSGLADGLGWLRRQTAQPVLQFQPVLDNLSTPPVLDTIDPEIGIVREFRITGEVWARYEVWKQWEADPDPVRLAWRRQVECTDVSLARGAPSLGSIWRLRCVGYVFAKTDASVPFDQAPNRVLASEFIQTEARRMVINLPGQAAVNVGDGNSCHVNTNGRIIGGSGGAGIYYPAGTGTPTTGPASANRVTGSPALATSATYDDSFHAVFGLELDELKSMADLVVTDPTTFPSPIAGTSLIVIDATSTHFTNSMPLIGNAIVIAIGNVNIDPGSYTNFSGLLYVDGNLTMRDPSEIRGAVVCTGNLTLQGSSDFATILYDEGVLSALQQNFGNYSLSSTRLLPRRSN